MDNVFYIVIIITIFSISGCINMGDYISMTDSYRLQEYVDKKVKVTGRISDMPWQHLIGNFEKYSEIYYFDIKEDQIVIYSKMAILCSSSLTIYGTVVKVTGKSKRPGSNEEYTEYHILVDRWECG